MSETATQHTGVSSSNLSRREKNLDSWREVKLGDIVRFGNGKTRPKTEGEFPVYGGNGILGYVSQSNYEGETIIIGRVGAYWVYEIATPTFGRFAMTGKCLARALAYLS